MSARKRGGVRPTHEWKLLVPLFEWPEQERYEEIRPLVLFDASVAERAQEVPSRGDAPAGPLHLHGGRLRGRANGRVVGMRTRGGTGGLIARKSATVVPDHYLVEGR